jgi:Uma2 family endonuclease
MSVSTNKATYTPADLLSMPDGDMYELVNGQLVERKMGFRSSRIGGRLFHRLWAHCDKNRLGWVLPADAGYQCFPDDPNKVRKPDVSFIRADRLSADEEPEGHCRLAPDLAVEVVSPHDLFEEIAVKVTEYLAAGVRMIWVLDPATQRIHIHRQDSTGTILTRRDELTGEDVVPGFCCPVAELFRPPAGVSSPE